MRQEYKNRSLINLRTIMQADKLPKLQIVKNYKSFDSNNNIKIISIINLICQKIIYVKNASLKELQTPHI